MHQNKWWLCLLVVVLSITFFFASKALYHVYQWQRLSREASAQIITWKVVEVKGGYAPEATYTFDFRKKSWQGTYAFSKYPYRNTLAAEAGINELKFKPYVVHFRSSNPLISSLERAFPLKDVISALILIGIFVYFVQLGYKVGYESNRPYTKR